jgi:hypothetical protein
MGRCLLYEVNGFGSESDRPGMIEVLAHPGPV